MNSRICLFLCLPVLLLSCATYKKASLGNLQSSEINNQQSSKLEFVLKKQALRYVHVDARYQVNSYRRNSSSPDASYRVHLEDNIAIPKGAAGRCVKWGEVIFIIDFGEGIQIPFSLSEEDNKPASAVTVDQKNYVLDTGSRKSRLFFKARGLSGLN